MTLASWKPDTHHPAALFSATRTKSFSPASSPRSPTACATAAVAMAGLKPRFCRAETASALAEPSGAAGAPAPGALGRPVWLLNRYAGDWRWMYEREDSPWYPGMRIFNQTTHDDWDNVLQRVETTLRDLASSAVVTHTLRPV